MTKAATAPAPPAPEGTAEDVFDVVVPAPEEGEAPLQLEGAEPEAEPEAPKPPKQPKAAKPPEPTVEGEEPPARPQKPLDPAAREERAKRKQYARLWETAAAERDQALAALERLKHAPVTPATKEARANLVAKADEAGSMGKLMELTLEEFDRRDAGHREAMFALGYQHAVEISQINARIRHEDYDDVVQKAGILEAVSVDPATGQWKDPAIAKRIYYTRDGQLRADPAEEAYRLAVGRLEYEADQRGEEPETPAATAARNGSAASNGKPAAPVTEDAVEEARKQGAREVQEKVAANVSRPKGISGMRSAGPPGTSRLSRAQLDELMEREPRTYDRLVRANPELERWHLGG